MQNSRYINRLKNPPQSVFAETPQRSWGPKTKVGRLLALTRWLGHLLERTGLESIRELQYLLFPRLYSPDGTRKRIRKHQALLNAISEGRFPQDTTILRIEEMVKESARQPYSPLWEMLESSDAMGVWRRRVRHRLVPHLAGMWERFERTGSIGSIDRRAWMREACRVDSTDALMLMTALYLLLQEKGQSKAACEIMHAMIRTLIIEHSRFPVRPWEAMLFRAFQWRIWRVPPGYWKGYRFHVASATAIAIRACQDLWKLELAADLDTILLPGKEWKQLGPPPKGVLAQVELCFSPVLVPLSNVAKVNQDIKSNIRRICGLPPLDPMRVGLSWRKVSDRDAPFLGVIRLRGVKASYFCPVHDTCRWQEDLRKSHPLTFNALMGKADALTKFTLDLWDTPPPFEPFPKRARTLYAGANFSPI